MADRFSTGIDSWVKKVNAKISQTISHFAAFVFVMIAVGGLYAYLVMARWPSYAEYFLILPALLGLVAYYNRLFAIVIFALALIVILI